MSDIIQIRRDSASNWTTVNPTLAQGEQGLELDTGKTKFGDGTTAWASLAYSAGAEVNASNVDSAGAVMNTDQSTSAMQFVVDEDNMASDSASKIPTQQSVKAYVDASGGDANSTLASAVLVDNTLVKGDGGVRGVQDTGIVVDDSDNISAVNSLKMTAISAPSHAEGLMYYNSTCKCFTYYNDHSDVAMNIGRELWSRQCNNTGLEIADGRVVYISGVDTGCPECTLAQPDEFVKSRMIGITTEAIADGSNGEVTAYGLVNDINTVGLSVGVIYLTDDGVLTSTSPTGDDYNVIVGVCLVVGASGTVFVNPNVSSTTFNMIDTNGFPNRDDSTMSFDNGTNTFSISPAVTSFHYYVDGMAYKVSATDSKAIDDTEGLHVLYYDDSTLTAVANPTPAQIAVVIRTKCICAYIYWDATNSQQIYFADERHGLSMSPTTHAYLHFTRGAIYSSGMGLGDIVSDDTGDVNTHAQFSVASGAMYDEDLYLAHDAVASTVGLPIYYLSGSTGALRKVTQSGYSVYITGSANGNPYYNEWTGSTWQLTEVTNTDIVLCHVFAINSYAGEPEYVAIMGQEQYTSINLARAGANTELSSLVSSLPFEEMVPVGTVLFQCNSNLYDNAVNARILTTDTSEDYVDWRTSEIAQGSTPSDHNNLTNLEYANTGIAWGHINDQVQTIYGVKTFNSFGITPSSAPTTDYQWANKKYVDDNSASATTLSALTDTTITGTPADNEVLAWDTSAGKWINQTASEAGLTGGSTAVDDLSDVTITSVATNDQLIYTGSGYVNRQPNHVDVSAIGSKTGAYEIDVADGVFQTITATGNLALTLTGTASGESKNITLIITASGADRTITFPASWDWPNAPTGDSTVVSSGEDLILTILTNGTQVIVAEKELNETRSISADEVINGSTNGIPTLTQITNWDALDSVLSDEGYDDDWDGDTTHSASKNAIYDKIEDLELGGGGVDTSGTITVNDFAKFSDSDTLVGRSYSEVKTDLGLATTSTDNAVSKFDSTSGNTQDSGVIISDDDDISDARNISYTGTPKSGGNSLTSSATVTPNMHNGDMMTLTLDHGTTLALPSNIKTYSTWQILVTQGSTGGTMAYNAGYKFTEGVAPTLSSGAGKVDLLTFSCFSSSTVIYCAILQDVKS